ncbi:hypothetical protein [Photobacterium leiognathi]|uniref:hypothetical protein n=1 Tax=Photobacterium leiognathi TaxID=553611 RepID=UPI002982B1AD|nr:hypothetical protein [Photobacterium leiognathi]
MRSKYHQSGMTTLLITSMLLIVSLLFSLASYKNLFYQIKRTQNEVLARQAHWAAEGGLECGFSALHQKGNISDALPSFDNCKNKLSISKLTLNSENIIKSGDALSDNYLNKKIKISSGITGAIQSRSDLKLIGSYNISPDVEDKVGNKYKCIAIRFSKEIHVQGSVSVINPTGNVSYDGFLSGGECLNQYKTNTSISGSWDIDKSTSTDNPSGSGLFKLDLARDTSFDPFEPFFKDVVSNISEIKKDYNVISGSKSSNDEERCDYLISEEFKISDKVWVEGDCDLLDATKLNDMGESNINKPKILVIEDGIVATWGTTIFKGVLYHYINKSSNIYQGSELQNRWELMPSYNVNGGNNSVKINHVYNSVYINGGSFLPTGGMIFDTLNGHTTLTTGMTLTFTTDVNPNPIEKNFSWQEGSWNDL